MSARGWWRTFDDPELDRLVMEALDGNRDLGAAAARVDRAVAQARSAGADLYASPDASFTATIPGIRASRRVNSAPRFCAVRPGTLYTMTGSPAAAATAS